jgi:TonB family protein
MQWGRELWTSQCFFSPKKRRRLKVCGFTDVENVSAGKYDALFQGAPNKPSDLYRAAQDHPFPPVVRLLNSSPPLPVETFVPPKYPPLARLTGIGGRVSFKIEVDSNGRATNLSFESAHPLLRQAVSDAVSQWQFPKESTSQQIQITIEFGLNCPERMTSELHK